MRAPTTDRATTDRPSTGHGRGARPDQPTDPEPELEESFDRLVDEGHSRLTRPLLTQVGTGLLGGIDIATGLLAYLVVLHDTGSELVASLAFSTGFVALLLAHSELFTENFLVPVTAVAARRGSLRSLLSLWGISLVANLAAGWGATWLIVIAMPELRETAVESGRHYAELGLTGRSFVLAILAGLVITLLTRMQHSTESLGVQLVPAVLFGSLLVGANLFHSVLDSMMIFTGIHFGADYGYGTWAPLLVWSVLGNIVGGVGLVTGLRLLRTGYRVVQARETG